MSKFTFFDSSDSEDDNFNPITHQVERHNASHIKQSQKINRSVNFFYSDSSSSDDGENQTGGAAVTRNQTKRLRLIDNDHKLLQTSEPPKDAASNQTDDESFAKDRSDGDQTEANDNGMPDQHFGDDDADESLGDTTQTDQGASQEGAAEGTEDHNAEEEGSQDHLTTSTSDFDSDTLVVQNDLVEAHIYKTYFRRQKNFS